MSERLFIRLGKTLEHQCSWLVWSEQEQEIIASGDIDNAQGLSTLSLRAGNRPVDVLVPASAMTLTQVSLPEQGQKQALKALPFMLEETIADDVEAMHFAVGPREGDSLSVVAVAHEQMQMWLNCLADAGLTVKNMVPDCLALPLAQCQWATMRLGDEVLLRTGAGAGYSLPLPWLPMALTHLLPSAPSDSVTLASYTDVAIEGVELRPQPLDLPMLTLARGALQAPINLLCGAYRPKREYGQHLSLWRNAAITVGVVVILTLVNKGLTIYQTNQNIVDLKAQSEAIFQQVMPANSRVVNLRSQMDRQLRSLQGQGGGSQLFMMLDTLQGAFKQVPELKPNSLRFDSARNELRMQITAKNYAQIEQFKSLISQSFHIDGGTMNSSTDQVTSTLTLRSK